jgi:hypothetical protein
MAGPPEYDPSSGRVFVGDACNKPRDDFRGQHPANPYAVILASRL